MSEPKHISQIGRHEYRHLKGSEKLNDDQKAQIEDFEKRHNINQDPTPEQVAYFEKLMEEPDESEIVISPVKLANAFIVKWEEMYGKSLILTDEMKQNLRTLTRYFSGDENFKEGCSDINEPSLGKGLLIIGDFGNGKTSSMRVFYELLKNLPGKSFKSLTSSEVVDNWEACGTTYEKQMFWSGMVNGRSHFDDVLREREANNYGKVDVFRDIFLRRYDSGSTTFITCNPAESGNLEDSLELFANRYGEIVYDRLFQMFNIIDWKGKSFRR